MKRLWTKTIIFMVLLTSLVALTIGYTLTWYSRSRHVSEIIDNAVTTDTIDISAEGFKMYYWEKTVGTGGENTVYNMRSMYSDTDDSAGNPVVISMIAYDMIQNENSKTPVIIAVPVRGSAVAKRKALTVSLSALEQEWFVLLGNGRKSMTNFLSNIVKVSCAAVPASVLDDAAYQNTSVDETVWRNVTAYFTDNEASIDSQNFVSLDPNERYTVASKDFELEFSITGYTPDSTNDSIYICFKVDYDLNLAKTYMYGSRNTIRFGDASSNIIFDNDFIGGQIEATVSKNS